MPHILSACGVVWYAKRACVSISNTLVLCAAVTPLYNIQQTHIQHRARAYFDAVVALSDRVSCVYPAACVIHTHTHARESAFRRTTTTRIRTCTHTCTATRYDIYPCACMRVQKYLCFCFAPLFICATRCGQSGGTLLLLLLLLFISGKYSPSGQRTHSRTPNVTIHMRRCWRERERARLFHAPHSICKTER